MNVNACDYGSATAFSGLQHDAGAFSTRGSDADSAVMLMRRTALLPDVEAEVGCTGNHVEGVGPEVDAPSGAHQIVLGWLSLQRTRVRAPATPFLQPGNHLCCRRSWILAHRHWDGPCMALGAHSEPAVTAFWLGRKLAAGFSY